MIEWCEDSGLTPLVAVNAELPGVRVPQDFVEEGRITLNVNFSAMKQREISNDALTGYARFNGRSEMLDVPMAAIEALVVRETGEGMMFPNDADEAQSAVAQRLQDEIRAVTDDERDGAADEDTPEDEPPRPPRGRPNLKLVK
ncbi:ClpXP protease specificity-enhancing factor [Oceanococcus atlanticus]|uniref:ClpXP protease specificity-enhancing factor n=2 Tax=Oceanococcus atlanticus TaxID=1317117 RepID=A0A1Y1SAQ8_9GAMM|nr:ClpXP protease specificity-enhancing factor [Oceanococcus atlanticus]